MSKFSAFCLICILVLISCPNIFADQIVLKNGDRLTGKIIKKDGDKIVIETESMGTVSILWTAVEKIVADEPLNIKLSDGQMIKGTVATTDDEKLNVETKDAGKIEVAKENVALIRNEAEQAKFEAEEERLRDPGLFDLWTGSADVGFSLTTGNSKTRALTVGARAARETRKDKIGVYINAIQASNSTTGVSVTTAQAVWLGGRYDYNLNKKTFVFATANFEYDKPQQLKLRSVFGGGFGYRWIRSDRTSLDLFGGATYNRESFSNGTKRNSAEALFGEELKFKVTKTSNLEQTFRVYPNLTRAGDFRAMFDASFVTTLNKWLGWHVTIGDRFNSNPITSAKKNDLLFTTGLRATFGRTGK